ncbi:MAG TPA: VOC family protein [Salinimicrobium sp.]|nr:VOC family protein [Salinimicrobium sp.]
MTTINPYLTFNGTCEEAFNLYQSVFGGEFQHVNRYSEMPSEHPLPESEKNKIMHIALPISKETMLMGSDSSAVFGTATQIGDNVSISINTTTDDEAKRIFEALSAGGEIKMPLEKTFWGALFGMFTDKFGIHWMVNCDGEEKQNQQ